MSLKRLYSHCENWWPSVERWCLILSSYFIQDGFVKVVDYIVQIFLPISFPQKHISQSNNELVWRLLDGITVFSLGFMCFHGIERRQLNLIRWPTLVLFIYRVVEYLIEHLHRLYTANAKPISKLLTEECTEAYHRTDHVEWIGHFLIPSIHLSLITVFLWRSVPTNGGGLQPIKYHSTNIGGGGGGISCNRSHSSHSSSNDEMRLLDISEQDD